MWLLTHHANVIQNGQYKWAVCSPFSQNITISIRHCVCNIKSVRTEND